MLSGTPTSELTPIEEDFLRQKNCSLFLLREDIIHPVVSGNKWRKLKYNLSHAQSLGESTILTFGGAYSNHIVATAFAAAQYGFKSIGVIRGEEHLPLNPTLQEAIQAGMELHYADRVTYKDKDTTSFIHQLEQEFGSFYLVPEGGSNALAVKGCTEILTGIQIPFDVVCCACGTGGTLAGLAAHDHGATIYGFPALKGGQFLKTTIENLLNDFYNQENNPTQSADWNLINDYHFGGYAKIKPELIDFVRSFKKQHQIELDLIYTGKMMYGLFDRIKNTSQFDGSTIIAVHTGGIQGNRGFEQRLGLRI